MNEHVSPQGFTDWDAPKLVAEHYGEWGASGMRADLSARHPRQKRLADEGGQWIALASTRAAMTTGNPIQKSLR